MKLLLRIFIGLLFTINIFAQKQGAELLDSLLIELPKAAEDTNKVNLLAEISYNYRILIPKKGIEFANQGVELAKKINWKIGLAKNYNSLMQNYWAIGNFNMAYQMFENQVKTENEIGLNQQELTSKLKDVNAIFTYPTSDYTNLTNELRNYLNDLVLYLKENPSIVLTIVGHSDNFGSRTQNETRAKVRTETIVNFLTSNGISKKRLLVHSKGSLEPVANNDTEAGRKKNRRVEIKALSK